jgi:hypothetical protein
VKRSGASRSAPAAPGAAPRSAGAVRELRHVVDPAGRPARPPTRGDVLQLQRSHGNQLVQRLLGPAVLQRTPLSDDLARSTAAKSPAAVFTVVAQQRFRDGALDPTELAALTRALETALPKPDDRWLALRIMSGKLGMSGGVTTKESRRLKKDIPPQPIEVSFVEGRSDQRALVVAGVHGSERQGIDVARALLDVLQKRQPHYSVVVVPSLFPQHADPGWGVEGVRQRGTQTNRNFPSLDQEVGSYSGGQALDPSGKPIQAAKDDTGTARPILAENVMLMELIDRFHPTRIISIHGTHDSSAAGVFADPHFISPEKEKAIKVLAGLIAFVTSLFGVTGPDEKALTEAFTKADATRTQNDIDLALATAYAIADRTKAATSLGGRFPDAKDSKKKSTPSVAGNKLYAGAGKESAVWREDFDPTTGGPKPWKERADKKGISLGLYAPAKGISVFTVEPPVNRALDFYDKNTEPGGAKVSKADRQKEIVAYAEAVALVLLGPDAGKDALATQRPASP